MTTASFRKRGAAATLFLLALTAHLAAATAAPDAVSAALDDAGAVRFVPYGNESDVVGVGPELTVENRLDRVTIVGSVDLTLDREGARKAEALRTLLDRVCASLRDRKDLPERVAVRAPATIANPFE